MVWWLAIIVGAFVLIRVVVWAGYRYGDRHSPRPMPTPSIEDPEPIGVLCTQPLVHELPSPAPGRFRWASMAGADAIAALRELDRLGGEQGWCAIIVGDAKSLPQFDDAEAKDPAEVLRMAEGVDVASWFEARLDELLDGEELDSDRLGDWISERDARTLMPVPYAVLRGGVLDRFHDRIYLALVPTEHAWQAPAYLQNGGWNEVPEAAEQVAVLRYWNERHGARLRAFSSDVMELDVARLPADRDRSFALAREQFAFCNDVVDQGVGALRPLACALQVSRNWYFWWD